MDNSSPPAWVLEKGPDGKLLSHLEWPKRQKYEDNSAAINASERNRHWNDPAVRLAKRAVERTHGSPNYLTTQRLRYVVACQLYCTSIKKL